MRLVTWKATREFPKLSINVPFIIMGLNFDVGINLLHTSFYWDCNENDIIFHWSLCFLEGNKEDFLSASLVCYKEPRNQRQFSLMSKGPEVKMALKSSIHNINCLACQGWMPLDYPTTGFGRVG